jgi:hypothetical protein
MRTRSLICLFALALTACTETLEAVAPRVFYGRLVSADDAELCLADPREEDPERERCFVRGEVELPEDVEEGDIVNLRYELEGERERALSVVEALDT